MSNKYLFIFASLFLFIGCGETQPVSSSTPTVPVAQEISYEILETYSKAGEEWHNIVVDVSLSSEGLKSLAKQLHTQNPDWRFHIFNDDTQFKAFADWDIHYSEPDSKYVYPELWANKHLVASVHPMWPDNQWKLLDGWGSELMSL